MFLHLYMYIGPKNFTLSLQLFSYFETLPLPEASSKEKLFRMTCKLEYYKVLLYSSHS